MPVQPDHATLPAADVLLERTTMLADEAATATFGERFARALEAVRSERRIGKHAFKGLQVQLIGDLGAGKTTLVRATLRALGHTGRVRSPTYTLVEPYTVELPDTGSSAEPSGNAGRELAVYHFDLYRFNDPAEWADAGFREYFDSGAICLVEWPQRAGALLGVPDLVFSLEVEGDGRRLTARAYSEPGKACLERC
ncbi:tRNA (adenosine(37)-N6)-threonylcarbamoyltransferase complex ATPase subunit type 1 TsaE [Paraburkholderia sp. SARCC-3016]|uniref:tRNA (adenosine(37)-N6)-threonylcarbamoyltransferase complex ATPase subunit type 1 TsaE n=1 Tax=Paraburkholderia sp. SARCC-3016 TaxID=3058611 RepID=UPI0028082969|nr:tRNA (adenosine(37)-N6)-threonylcarbamoyltransferase complex ATPase subunit type 1 TsaE [Paraburkholderia sp. SARCC-3016]MDQ7975820.1 tRNA (adenosine(37)-N6)-threonylcarbamoyltransferase complex ATPase subunit type 1 TsaE [Paraburkholderia sp. SARCC-3016]